MTTTATHQQCFIVSAPEDVNEKLLDKVLQWLRNKSGSKSAYVNVDESVKALGDDTRILVVLDTLPKALAVAKSAKKTLGEAIIIRLGSAWGAGDKDNVHAIDVPARLTDKAEFDLFRKLSSIWRVSHPRTGHVERPRPKLPWE